MKKQIDGQQIEIKTHTRYPEIHFDRLQMYFMEPYVIDVEGVEGTLTIYQPTIGDLVRIGEDKFYSTLSIITGNTTQFRALLWKAGIDWNEISDFQFFCSMYKELDKDALQLLFRDVDITAFDAYDIKYKDGRSEPILINEDQTMAINEDVYQHFHQYYQVMFNMKPEEEFTKDKFLKEWWIQKDEREAARKAQAEKEGKDVSTSIQPLISAYVNHPGTKHSLQELKEVGVYEFYDSIQRLQIYESSTACLKGMFSGFVDSKSIKPEDYNWLKEIT